MKNLLKETFVDYKFALAMACMFTLANYCLTVHRENVRLEGVIELAEMRSDVNNDFVNELLWSRLNDFDYQTNEMLISQGRIEGVIDYINKHKIKTESEFINNLLQNPTEEYFHNNLIVADSWVFKTEVFKSDAWKQWSDAVRESHGIFKYRWGENTPQQDSVIDYL